MVDAKSRPSHHATIESNSSTITHDPRSTDGGLRAFQGFSCDDVGYGFDNIGDVLTLPPILMEKYVHAAEQISQEAIIAPPSEPPFELVSQQPARDPR